MSLQETHQPGPDLALYEPGRGKVPLSTYWQDGPAVFVFLRHFG
jgi:hypothetical protein